MIEAEPCIIKNPPVLSQSTLSGPDDFLGKLERISLDEISDHLKVRCNGLSIIVVIH